MINLILLSLSVLFLLFKIQYANAQEITPGKPPIGGKAVYIKETNTIWIFSFTNAVPITKNKQFFINLNQSFSTINPPVMDSSFRLWNDNCPVMHFAQAHPAPDGVSVNIFGSGSGQEQTAEYEKEMTLCEFNTINNNWKQIRRSSSGALPRRNAAFAVSQTGSTYIWGGISDVQSGLPPDAPGYPTFWNHNVTIYDEPSGWIDGPVYNGAVRTNATMTEISNTNAQMVIIGGAYINNESAIDMMKNFPLANMSEIIVLDPRYSKWIDVIAKGESPPPRKHHTTTLHPDGHTLIVIGGEYHNSSGVGLFNDVWTLDTSRQDSFVWNKIDVGGDTGYFRSNHTSLLIDDQIWVIAGTNASNNAVDIQLLNVTSWTWTSNYNSKFSQGSPSYASIGGVKGLIGIVVGTICGALAVIACLLFWWCRRKRINPFSKNKKPSGLPEHDGMVFIPNNRDNQQHYYNSQCQETATTEINSRLTSRPSMSTTTSGGLALTGVGGNWANTQHMNSFTTTSPTSNNYYVPQYTSGPVASPIPTSEQYYNNSDSFNSGYFHDSRNNSLVPIPGCIGSPTGAVYSSDLNRQMVWDNSAQTQHQPQHMSSVPEITQFVDHDYMLTPMGSRPVARPQPLQKPNEVDPADLISPPTTASTTVYTSSTNEEDRSVTPGNSNDGMLRSPNRG